MIEAITEPGLRNIERSKTGLEWRVKLVKDIDSRGNPLQTTFGELEKESVYCLHIDYNIPGARSYEARNLTYEELRTQIARNLVSPSNQLMNIYVSKGPKE